jgi:mannose-6-phosphate isomerase-like protein (cupin superfamily)
MPGNRPQPVGAYEVIQDFENSSMSIRVIRMAAEAMAINAHVHQRSAQVYVALSGSVRIECDGVETVLRPYDVLSVPIGSLHRAHPVDGAAIVMNISVPPLAANDQAPATSFVETSDMRLPRNGSDVDD